MEKCKNWVSVCETFKNLHLILDILNSLILHDHSTLLCVIKVCSNGGATWVCVIKVCSSGYNNNVKLYNITIIVHYNV